MPVKPSSNENISATSSAVASKRASTEALPTLPAAVQEAVSARIRAHDLRLPVLDSTTQQVVSLCNDPEATMEALAKLVTTNQALAANVLRLVNTPAYAPRDAVVSLAQAISRLGMQKIREIALIVALQDMAFDIPGYEDDLSALTLSSLCGALFAQEIARSRRWSVEESFLCGLLRNIGHGVAIELIVSSAAQLKVAVDPSAVRQVATRIHPVLGSSLLGAWKLPARVGEAVRYYQSPDKAPTASGTAHATALADSMALWFSAGAGDRDVVHQHGSLLALNMYPDEVDAILDKSPAIASALGGLRL